MDEAVGIVVIIHQTQSFTHSIRLCDTVIPKVSRQFTYTKCQHTHSDRADLIVTNA